MTNMPSDDNAGPAEHAPQGRCRRTLDFILRVYLQPFWGGAVWAGLHVFVLLLSAMFFVDYFSHGDLGPIVEYDGYYEGIKPGSRAGSWDYIQLRTGVQRVMYFNIYGLSDNQFNRVEKLLAQVSRGSRMKISCYDADDDVCQITRILDVDRNTFLSFRSYPDIFSDRKKFVEQYARERKGSLGFAITLLLLPVFLLRLFEDEYKGAGGIEK